MSSSLTYEATPGPIVAYARATFLPDGKRIGIMGREAGAAERLWIQDLAGGDPRPIAGPGFRALGHPVSPDSARLALVDRDGTPVFVPVEGGAPTPIPGLARGHLPLAWTADGKGLWIAKEAREFPVQILRLDLTTGRLTPHREIQQPEAGALSVRSFFMTPDGRYYVMGYVREVSDLYLLENVQ